MDDNFKFQAEIRERLATIETMLKDMNYCYLEKTANEALKMSESKTKELAKLQSAQTWLIRTVIGAIIAGIMALVLNK